MSFKRRETSNSSTRSLPKGVRPSSANGEPVTSTGCGSLDSVLSGHGGLPLGTNLLIQENGTTDFAAVLLRYFAAEGLSQGHAIWLAGSPLGDSPSREFPGCTDAVREDQTLDSQLDEKMKIAWRYNNLGDFGSGLRSTSRPSTSSSSSSKDPYCHSYDLTKRMTMTPELSGRVYRAPPCGRSGDPFAPILQSLISTLSTTSGLLRCLVPGLLSPATFPPTASQSKYLVKFINNLRAVCRAHSHRVVMMMSMPLDLYPRTTPSTAWLEILVDGVIELMPLPNSAAARGETDGSQGLLKIHKVPLLERLNIEADLSFKVSRRRFSIEAWSLPALGEEEPREGGGTLKDVKQSTIDITF